MRFPNLSIAVLIALSALGCSTTRQVDPDEPKRLMGQESDVRVNAQIGSDTLTASAAIGLTYEIENRRATAIAVADLIPDSSFDPDSRTITIGIGSEVPGNETIPRLILIASGEKRAFSAGARVNVPARVDGGQVRPQYLRVRVNFLTDVEPFRALIGIPERIIRDPKLAADLFPRWVDTNDSVMTNAIPITWELSQSETSAEQPLRRR
ncbi:MAG TPA: hypothetical protein VNM92_11825 [Thermoanaerobaculia bacterium]|nr:hypothetical protein [Thermoanaerobaculia bacterium]